MSEAFVTLPHHAGLESYMILKELKERYIEQFSGKGEVYVDDKAKKLPTNPTFGLKQKEEKGDEAESERILASIIV